MELVGLAEIADMLGVAKQVVANWRARKGSFPSPTVTLKSGPVWDADTIRQWALAENIPLATNADIFSVPASSRIAIVAAIMNMKGGVGKSTLTANVGWYAAYYHNLRVLMVDLDPQFNLSQYVMGVRGYEKLLDDDRPMIDQLFQPSQPCRAISSSPQ
jgi:chromosome partitioning protein